MNSTHTKRKGKSIFESSSDSIGNNSERERERERERESAVHDGRKWSLGLHRELERTFCISSVLIVVLA